MARIHSLNGLRWTGLLLILLGFGGFLYWAMVVPLAQGVVASGMVMVDGKRKNIQHLEGGIIKSIRVKEGDRVVTGQLLVELDDTRARAEYSLLRMRLLHALAKVERLEAERDGSELLFRLDGSFSDKERREIIALQQGVYSARRAQLDGQIEILQQQIQQLRNKVTGLKEQLTSLREQQGLVGEELEKNRKLFQKKLAELTHLLKLQKEGSVLKGEVGRVESRIAATRVAMGEAELEIMQLRNNRDLELSEELLLSRERVLELYEQIAAAEDVLKRTMIYAPEAGVVLDLETNTVGGVLPPGVSLMELVPESDRLVIEARIQPADVDHVYRGIRSRVRLLAFKQRTTPLLWGEVDFLSADALQDEQSNQSYYLARIVVDQQQLDRLDPEDEIVPGMPAEVLIDAGQRTAMEYWLDPIEDVVRRGMREQ